MMRRLSRGIAAGICLLLALASAYRAGASPPTPGKGTQPGQGAIALDSATERRPSAHTVSAQVEPAAAAMTEDFEGAWPAPGWDVSDLSTVDGGEYFWGKRNCHPHASSFAGWAVGGGAQGSGLSCSANYPNNARSWAVYGPFDLRGASAASLTYHFWGRTEVSQTCGFDFLFVGSAVDATNFQGARSCGDWTGGPDGNGYYRRTLDLSSRLGQAQVWVAFVLASDGSIDESGIAIDDITLDVGGSITPTATPSPTPTVGGPTTTPTPGHGLPRWLAYLPVVIRAAGSTPVVTPSPTATPGSTSTATPSLTATPGSTSTATPSPTATPTQGPSYNGSWSGTTSQDRPISFTVANNAVTYLQLQFYIPGCTITVFNYSTTPITGNTFTVSSSAGGASYTVVGTLDSSTSASGSFQVTQSSQFCNGSTSGAWTAAKQ